MGPAPFPRTLGCSHADPLLTHSGNVLLGWTIDTIPTPCSAQPDAPLKRPVCRRGRQQASATLAPHLLLSSACLAAVPTHWSWCSPHQHVDPEMLPAQWMNEVILAGGVHSSSSLTRGAVKSEPCFSRLCIMLHFLPPGLLPRSPASLPPSLPPIRLVRSAEEPMTSRSRHSICMTCSIM